ncbi:hypothetical protein LTR70_000634 [Exophiala xenobiotica]|uniref:Uncharacterized protein n=1 Tax=Lithohypha guttulata TaxID=1690604 RepID=A0ABR0KIM4_9EURO|nr:hypothetical protein LTR24_002119 [Lithohypha guttulata]KAK5329485.1 hypothetical protein LTR70_000634 [Exophiala xenobiotica]
MLFSPTTVLVTTINIAAVLAILYWARFLVKHIRENTEFADLLLQHERIEADTKPLGIWKGNVSKQQDAISTQQEARTARSAGGSRSRVLRNIDVWKRAKYEAVWKGPGPEDCGFSSYMTLTDVVAGWDIKLAAYPGVGGTPSSFRADKEMQTGIGVELDFSTRDVSFTYLVWSFGSTSVLKYSIQYLAN